MRYFQFIEPYMKKTLFFCAIILVLSSCGGGSSSSDSGSASSAQACNAIGLQARIINGNTCSETGSSVLRVLAQVDLGREVVNFPVCTGTLVTPNTVITAAHCFLESTVAGFPVVGYAVYVGEAGSGQVIPAADIAVAPGVRVEQSVGRWFNDAALILLKSSLSLPLMPILLSRSVQTGEDGFVYGYGAREQGDTTEGLDFAKLQSGTMTIQNVTPNHIFVAFSGNGVNVCNGDSGGPLVVLVNGQPALAGVTSQGSKQGCVAGDVTTFTNLQQSDVLNWLRKMIPSAYVRTL
ncbi:MAG: hypothetical protein D6719_12370 [Candidatus Dadabacteria bacterium]|nr:MAG: hypothetical protein D6719_12370 [Candidatus Dadabacteria bacterium]